MTTVRVIRLHPDLCDLDEVVVRETYASDEAVRVAIADMQYEYNLGAELSDSRYRIEVDHG